MTFARLRRILRAFRWPTALVLGLNACACEGCVPSGAPPVVLADGGDACVAACGRRAASSCLEARFAPTCVDTCHRAATMGLYDPVCVATAGDMSSCKGGPRGCR